MSQLEQGAAPVLSKLIFSERVSITDSDADRLAAWAMKTSVNAAFETHKQASQLVPLDLRDHLRQHSVPPDNVTVLAFRVEGFDTKVRTRAKAVPIRKPGGRQVDTALVSTVVIGRVALQMVAHHKAGAPDPKRPSRLDEAAVILWPSGLRHLPAGSNAFAWPPHGTLDGPAAFEAIADPSDDDVRAWMP
jgi:hypothetical protein